MGRDSKIVMPSNQGNHQMAELSAVIAVFDDHQAAEVAVKKLADAGIDIKNLSVVGKGFHTDEHVVGFYNAGDRIKFWGKRGAFWGGLWGWLFGGIFMFIPVVGHVVMLGYFAAAALAAIEGAVVVGGVSALGAALYSIGIPKDKPLPTRAPSRPTAFWSWRMALPRKWTAQRRRSSRSTRHVWMCMKAGP
jgi:hypothetical protein